MILQQSSNVSWIKYQESTAAPAELLQYIKDVVAKVDDQFKLELCYKQPTANYYVIGTVVYSMYLSRIDDDCWARTGWLEYHNESIDITYDFNKKGVQLFLSDPDFDIKLQNIIGEFIYKYYQNNLTKCYI